MDETAQWVKVDPDGLAEGQVMTVVAGGRALCLTRTAEGYGALDNRCPHQGGPLGDGQIEDALAHADGPSLVEIHSSSEDV